MASQQPSDSQQAQTFWLKWVETAFPDLDSRVYFLPPVYFNRVPMEKQSTAGQDVLVLKSLESHQPIPPGQPGQTTQSTPSTQASQSSGPTKSRKARKAKRLTQSTQACQTNQPWGSIPQPRRVVHNDIKDDSAMQRVFVCLQQMSEQTGEVMFGLTQLQFGQYLGEPCYAAAAAQLPLSASLPLTHEPNWKHGDFDVLLIHRHYGFIVCEVKAVGDSPSKRNVSQQDPENIIIKRLTKAVEQLKKAEAMLSHLVSDIAPGLRITKTIAVPNLTVHQVQQAISNDTQLTQDLCQCLGATDPDDIAGLCLCSDQLSDPKTPWDVSSHVLGELGHWWQRRVAGAGHDSHMTSDVYRSLVARFCGPATSVIVPCICLPRVSVKTLGQAVWLTGECYTAVITLFPEQVYLLNMAPSKLYVAGPPGTGKTVVLLLMAIEWLRSNNEVCVLSTCRKSIASCKMMYHLLQQALKTQLSATASSTKIHFLHFGGGITSCEKTVSDLLQISQGGSLHIIADEAAPANKPQYGFGHFLQQLEARVPHLYMWAASYCNNYAPAGWQVEEFRRSLRSPPAVVREVTRGQEVSTGGQVKAYISRRVPNPTDGPQIRLVNHISKGHSNGPTDCKACGREVASILQELHIGAPVTATSSPPATTSSFPSVSVEPPCLQWRDVLVLFWRNLKETSGMITGLREAGIPVRVMMKDDDIEDVATARSDVVWAALGDDVQGLERKVVVCLEAKTCPYAPVQYMSRCTAQLINVI